MDVSYISKDVIVNAHVDLPQSNVATQQSDTTLQEGEGERTLCDQSEQVSCDVEISERNHEVEEQSTFQCQRPVRVRKPPDKYGEWVLNCLQQSTTD